MATQPIDLKVSRSNNITLQNYLPFLDWLLHYKRENLTGDIIAGVIVAVMLVPQGMAYALLAGLPPEVGLYASIVPLFIYGLLGTSSALAVGPVAVMSILTASAIASVGAENVSDMLAISIALALMIGAIQLLMGILRVGFLVNFLSHPVLSGFTNAVAIVIAVSQLKHALGIDIPRYAHSHDTVIYALNNIQQTNLVVFLITALSVGVLLFFKFGMKDVLQRLGMNDALAMPITKSGPIVVVVLTILVVALFNLNERADVAIVGEVPSGVPPITVPAFEADLWQQLLPLALTISLVGYMESISVAKSLASRRRQKVDANQELVALGSANLGAAFTGGYPVAGGFARSMVNFTAGANTGLASIITAGLLLVTVLFFTPLFYYLPNAVLAAIILVAIASLIDVKSFIHTWRYSKSEGMSFLATFIAVLVVGVETGILVGVAVSLALYLWNTSRPHVAVIGRIGDSEEYRNVLRHDTRTEPNILALRVDESLYFPNAQYLEEVVLAAIADNPKIEHFVLVCSAVNFIDISALEVLESIAHALERNHVSFNMASVKGPVMDRLRSIGFVNAIGVNHFYLNTHQAIESLK